MRPPITVLIVDDNPELLDILAEGLALAGPFTVITALDGEQGIEQCLVYHPDCMVIDVKMSGLTGYQLVRAPRGDPQTADIPLILLTALAQDYERFAGLAAGSHRQRPISAQNVSGSVGGHMSHPEFLSSALSLRWLVKRAPRF